MWFYLSNQGICSIVKGILKYKKFRDIFQCKLLEQLKKKKNKKLK